MRRRLISWVGGASAVLVVASGLVVACSSSDDPGEATNDGGGSDARAEARDLFDTGTPDAGPEAAPPCKPEPLTTQPTWKPPRAMTPGVCSLAELKGYIASCANGGPEVCAAYAKLYAACYACIDSTDTDPTRGPVVWHANRKIYRVNYTGCVALAQGDVTANGCGAAYEAYQDCEDLACAACPTTTAKEVNATIACETDAGGSTICAPFNSTRNTKCAGAFDDAGPAMQRCIGNGLELPDYLLQEVIDWCGTADGGPG